MSTTPKICIVGAGFAGLCMAIKLKEDLNLETFTIFEANVEVGGTWYVNTYPGCACDVPSHFYSFSFSPKYDWSHSYSYQPEILEYMKDVTQKFNIYPHIRFQTQVESLVWDEERLTWTASILDLRSGKLESEDYAIVINSTGKIRIPHYPKEYLTFKGNLIHSSKWDHTVSLEGKRVGVIGTGASAVQIITTIADKVDQLLVFQRKAPYVLHRAQIKYPEIAKWAFANIPLLYRLSRAGIFWAMESTYPLTRHNSLMNKMGMSFSKWYRHFHIKDAKLRKETTPDYTLGCKRILLSENYYSTLAQPNVNLITSKITNVTGNIITTEDGHDIEVDVLVLATGYQPHDFFSPMKVYGKGGINVLEEWVKDRPKGFMGICSSSMPNFFTLLGPYSALGHSSNVYTIECQVHWTILAIKAMLQKDAKCLTLQTIAENEFMTFLDHSWKDTVWGNSQCGCWYLDAKGQNTTLWPLHQIAYWKWAKNFDENIFDFTN